MAEVFDALLLNLVQKVVSPIRMNYNRGHRDPSMS